MIASSAYAEEAVITILDNGLTVITQELHYAPIVASVISYRVGSRNETGDDLGLSHFLEHQMFKGTPDMPKSRFWQIVQRDGGSANAFTSNDITCYYLILPSSRIEDALAIESDRMVNCLLDSAEVISERNVVHEERRMRTTDSPNGALYEALSEIAYTEHPYSNPVIGYDDNILAYNPEDTRAYYETYYNPSNAVLTIVGDFKTEALLADVESYFGDIPSGTKPEENIPVEPEQTEARFIEIEHASNLPRFVMSFHAFEGNNSMNSAIQLIASYLSSGRAARLEQLLVDNNLVYGIYASNDGGIDPGLFTITVTMNLPEESEVTIEEVQDIIWTELESIIDNGIPEAALAKVKNQYLAYEILGNSNPVGLAMSYSLSQTMYGDYMFSQKQLDEIETLTTQDIQVAAEACFRRDNVNVAVLNPIGGSGRGMGTGQELPTRTSEPSSINYDGLEIPDEFLVPPTTSIADGVISYDLENGITLLVKEDHTFPVVSVSFSVPMGAYMHSAEVNGLASITTEMMLKGTEELEYTEFHNRLETEGSSLRFGAGNENSSGSITLLSEDIQIAYETIADLFQRPAFRQSDFELVMQENYTTLEAAAERGFSVAYDSLASITARTPADFRQTSRASLDRITLDSVIDFHNNCCRPAGTVIVVAGDVDPDMIVNMTEEYFGVWENPEEEIPAISIPEFTDVPGDSIVTFMEGRMQGTVLIATKAPGDEMDDYAAFSVMNTILGRGIGSRLGHSVRDEQGLAYGVGSWASSTDSSGIFSAYLTTLVDYVPQATTSVINEMETISTENVQDIELRLAKANLVGSQALSDMTYSGLASRLRSLQADGKPLDFNNIYLAEVLELTPDELREAAAKYFADGEWFISIAGSITAEEAFPE